MTEPQGVIRCRCCPDGVHVKCQHVVPGMGGGFPCSHERDGNSLYCEKHRAQHEEG